MEYTENLNLRKPGADDPQRVEDLNANMDALDAAVDDAGDMHAGEYDPGGVVKEAGGIPAYVEEKGGVGDMQSPDYDPDGTVKAAGGIPAYVSGAVDVLAILRAVYPVGSIYMNYLSTNPATLLGFGTWARIASGQVIVGVNTGDADFNAAGKTGGSKTHSHTLGGGYALLESASSTTYVQRKEDVASWQSGRQFSASASSTTGSRTAGTTLGGSTDSASNMPPYYTAYIWRRTA